jgi:hypothetical protein
MKIYCIRSDQGDGGWSLHLAGTEDEDGIPPTLLSGPANLINDEWDRPNADDYAAAKKAALVQLADGPDHRT